MLSRHFSFVFWSSLRNSFSSRWISLRLVFNHSLNRAFLSSYAFLIWSAVIPVVSGDGSENLSIRRLISSLALAIHSGVAVTSVGYWADLSFSSASLIALSASFTRPSFTAFSASLLALFCRSCTFLASRVLSFSFAFSSSASALRLAWSFISTSLSASSFSFWALFFAAGSKSSVASFNSLSAFSTPVRALLSSSWARLALSDLLPTWAALFLTSASLSALAFSFVSTSWVSVWIFSGVASFAFSRSFSSASFSAFLVFFSFWALLSSSWAWLASLVFWSASLAVSMTRFSALDRSLSMTLLFAVALTVFSVGASVAKTVGAVAAAPRVVARAAVVIIRDFFILISFTFYWLDYTVNNPLFGTFYLKQYNFIPYLEF